MAASARAFPSWSATSWDERAGAIVRFGEALRQVEGDLAPLLTREQGKPLRAAQVRTQSADHSASSLSSMAVRRCPRAW